MPSTFPGGRPEAGLITVSLLGWTWEQGRLNINFLVKTVRKGAEKGAKEEIQQ